VLLRIGKRRHTSSEVGAEQFCDAEFQDRSSGGLDRAISTYRVETQDLVRSHAEHYAGANLDPKGRPDFNLEGLAPDVVSVPLAGWPFATTAAAHCEIRCKSDQEVKTLAKQLFEHLRKRTHDVSRTDIRTYLRGVLACGDRESSPVGGRWWRPTGLRSS
jgi:hypothetical protein